ncbi:hypothetical protein TELCIR_17544 [Teladorsagia circumcincta]|uniref:Uncharacterized protein n=1 Tax=Teladorsagia circumcincta TaxID=45464 RepID=A0A2G9TSR2_TELCI|nr:hypothetical protein TELCIR_17544 [Teladorsagia circumcincta]
MQGELYADLANLDINGEHTADSQDLRIRRKNDEIRPRGSIILQLRKPTMSQAIMKKKRMRRLKDIAVEVVVVSENIATAPESIVVIAKGHALEVVVEAVKGFLAEYI